MHVEKSVHLVDFLQTFSCVTVCPFKKHNSRIQFLFFLFLLSGGCTVLARGACRQSSVAQETQMADEGRAYKRP